MTKLTRHQIQEKAMQVLEESPQGIRWAHLLQRVQAQAGDTPHNSIQGGIHHLVSSRQSEISKVARGTYQLSKYVEEEEATASAQETETVSTQVTPSAWLPAANRTRFLR